MNTIHNNKTKIVATIGPMSNSHEKLCEMVEAGMDVARLNFSHGKHEEHQAVIALIDKIAKEKNIQIGILADLQGPKLRIGEVEPDTILTVGNEITITNKPCIGNAKRVYLNYTFFAQECHPGDKVLINDGKIILEVIQSNYHDEVLLRVINGGELSSNKGVNLPNTKISLPAITEKDWQDLAFIFTQKRINWIALSFVRHANDILTLKNEIKSKNSLLKIIAKIEKPEAVENLDEILKHTDAIMVARGDLGVEIPLEQIPIVQKQIIKKSVEASKPVIVATQMMESMIINTFPTRAEITDVANAVIDGADAVMLSGETATGQHPALVIRTMDKIIQNVEQSEIPYNKAHLSNEKSEAFLSESICYNACELSNRIHANHIIGVTKSGFTAFMVSSCRPKANIFIFTDNELLVHTFALIWGVKAFVYKRFTSTDETISDLKKILISEKLMTTGDIAVNLGSMPLSEKGMTNMLKISII